MDALKNYALLLLFVSAACGIYRLLLPRGNISETAKRLLAVFFLSCVTLPLFTAVRAVLPETLSGETASSQDAYAGADAFAAAGEETLRRLAAGVLDAGTDVPYSIEIKTHIAEDLSIDIQQVRVIFERDFAGRAALIEALSGTLGLPVEAEVKHGGNETESAVDETQNG